ncbi:unnamed protein product [marine sediment metagenome]|uniref:Uncharacterized protein n=1 Tax=marine sediment metagenome TaxID=412755 RepID=X0ZIH8_9ZZZZ
MVKIKSAGQIDANYKAAIGRVPGAYKTGVMGTSDWQEKASSDAAESLYAEKVAEAVAAGRRKKAVSAVSNAEWQGAAANVGAARIGAGMTAGAGKRTSNFEPYRSAIEGVTLPARTADPLANVDARVKPIVSALVETKKSIKG